MAPNDDYHHRRQELELETNGGGLARGGSNHETGPTIESMPSEPGHDEDSRRSPWFVRFARWLRQPVNLMLFVWLIPVVGCLLLMLFLMTGALNGAIDGKERRKRWLEDANQVANALFTFGCLITHPEVFYHLLFVARWRPEDQEKVRGTYCSGRRPDPRDRKHLLVVVVLINLTWVGQYIMCGLYWAFNRHNRPGGLLNFWMVITLLAPVAAWLYAAKGPLRSNKTEEEAARDAARAAEESCRLRFCSGGAPVQGPQWDGSPFDCCDDAGVCLSSSFCTFWAFGRNMSRLGFGSRNMHAVTFLLAVVGPLAVFGVTALKVESRELRVVVVVSGAVIAWAGLLYGGYWRVKMRERFGLPENELCFGRPFLTDYFQWLFCGPCSLAQEVRTADNYDIEEGHGQMMAPIPRGGSGNGIRRLESNRSFSAPPKTTGTNGGGLINGGRHDASDPGFRRSSTYSKDVAMAPPQRPSM